MSVLHPTLKAAAFGSVITEINHNSHLTERHRHERDECNVNDLEFKKKYSNTPPEC